MQLVLFCGCQVAKDRSCHQFSGDRGQQYAVAVVTRRQPQPGDGAGAQQGSFVWGVGPKAPPALHRRPGARLRQQAGQPLLQLALAGGGEPFAEAGLGFAGGPHH